MQKMCTVRTAGGAYACGNHRAGCFYREDTFPIRIANDMQARLMEQTSMEFIEELGKAIINFGMKVIGAFETAIDEVKAAVEKVVDVLGALVDTLINMAKQLFSPIINKIKEMMQGIYDYLKSQFEALESLITGGEGNFTLLQDILNLPYLTYFLMLPTLISSIYYIISASSMGLGALVLNAVTMVLPLAISAAMGSSNSQGFSIPISQQDILKFIWGNSMDTSQATNSQKIAMISSLVGFTVSTITMVLIDKANKASTNTMEKLKMIDDLVKQLALALVHPSYYETWKDFEYEQNQYIQASKEHEELVKKDNEFKEALAGKKMARLGFIFSIFSVALSLTPLFGSDYIDPELKPIMFGLSVGFAVGSLIASIPGLSSMDRSMAFLSGIGIASSAVCIGVSVNEVRQL